MRDRTAGAAGDAGGAGRRRALRGDGQDVGGDRARAEERAQRPGHGGRADRAGSRQPGAGGAPAPAGGGRDRAPARRRRLAAVVLALAAHRPRARRSGRRRGARASRLLAELAADRGVDADRARAAVAARALRRAQGPGRRRQPGQERDRGGARRVDVIAARRATARRSSRSPTTGPGCRPEARAHLFEPFFTTKPNGTGLGLPTSRRFVEAHGGAHRGRHVAGAGRRAVPRAAAARTRADAPAPTATEAPRA